MQRRLDLGRDLTLLLDRRGRALDQRAHLPRPKHRIVILRSDGDTGVHQAIWL
jgi:hypothetical protein